jgi:hypothetical protein
MVDLEEWDAVRARPARGEAMRPGPEGLEILVIAAPRLEQRDDVDGRRDWWAD